MADPQPPKSPGTPPEPRPMTLWQTIQSVNASFFGVQSSKNRQRDFTRGKASHFIVVAVVMTLVVVGVIWIAVKLALSSAGQ